MSWVNIIGAICSTVQTLVKVLEFLAAHKNSKGKHHR